MISWITENVKKAMAIFTALGVGIGEAIRQAVEWIGS